MCGHLNSIKLKAPLLLSRKYPSGLNLSFPYNGLSIGSLKKLLYPKIEQNIFLKNSRASGSNKIPQVHATFFLNVSIG